ncbi:hypothetical protein EDD11_002155 [Mortierella claussenii]|nr:hypothetical protein EDD11_002155 [Mortierella claussenii]
MDKEEVYVKHDIVDEKRFDIDQESQLHATLKEDNDSLIEEFRAAISILLPATDFFSMDYSVVALLALPMGHILARTLPTLQFNVFGFHLFLNTGSFSIKEHALIGTVVACNIGTAYVVDIVIP